MRTVWILGDQLAATNTALAAAQRSDSVVLFVESRARGQRVRYHQQKLVLIYAAMRHFARELAADGWQVDYHALPDTPDFLEGLRRHVARFRPAEIVVTAPNDWATTENLPRLQESLGVPIRVTPTDMFLVPREEFAAWAGDSRHLVMENHYRRLRRRTGYLMGPDGQPAGGAWNFDPLNRRTYADYAKTGPVQPSVPVRESPDELTREVIAMVAREFPDHPGRAADFWFPVDRAGARRWLERFVEERLARFGPYEDVMAQDHPVIYHSVLSPLLNVGLLNPRECVEAAVAAYEQGRAPVNSVEGFVRQIIGWREFINGVYWHRMPAYGQVNHLEAARDLPGWFYTGQTEMNCLRQAIRQALDLGWLHHIQRLMVLGNFLLLAGVDPRQAVRWYLEITVDAYDWVMLPNVLGMILHADGGYMTTKPYAAGSGYINKMSNYCQHCRYDPKKKTGPDACPYNALYWDFYDRHADLFQNNPRVGMMVRTWQNRPAAEQQAVRASARAFLESQVPEKGAPAPAPAAAPVPGAAPARAPGRRR